jgi:dihydrofolate reductase
MMPMRKIIVSEFVTLDGVMEEPEKWVPQFWNADLQKFKDEEQFASGALLLGRKTYEIFAAAWASRTGDLAESINNIQKHVVSATLKKTNWNNSAPLSKNFMEDISKLKQQVGKDMLVVGSAQLVRTLLQHSLIDELRLMISPIIVGKGMQLFGESDNPMNMNLVETKTFNSNVLLIYRHNK